jgi:hypothetical protein
MDTATTVVFVAVIAARFVVPLFIPLVPLPAIVAALVLDAADQTIFQAVGYDPPGYQSYDKAMDVYYLSIAYLAVLRNWTDPDAVRIARFLFFYRQIGVVLFELLQSRALLLIFPNTFEYFFIAYEIVRLRWDPRRGFRFWVVVAAGIWVFVKLPQEYWIHVAQLDVTDTVAAYPEATVALAVVVAVLALVAWRLLSPRTPAPDHAWRVLADPLPAGIDTAAERDAWLLRHGRVLSADTVEKVFLVGLLSVIYAEVLPGSTASSLATFVGVAAFVIVNSVITLWMARRYRSIEPVLGAFVGRLALNVGLVFVADRLLPRREGDIDLGPTLFLVGLLSLLTLLDDRFRPVAAVRADRLAEDSGSAQHPTRT